MTLEPDEPQAAADPHAAADRDPRTPETRPNPITRNIGRLLSRLGADAPSMPPVVDVPTSDGSVAFSAERAVAGAWGTWELTFTVGSLGIGELGGVRVQLPEAWHAGIRNSAFRMQASFPREPNFVRAHGSRPDVRLQTIVELESDQAIDKSGRLSNLSGRAGYYDYVTRVIVRDGALAPGDSITLVYGDTSGGSRGFRVGINRSNPRPILVGVDHAGDGRFRLHADRPQVAIVGAEPAALSAIAPSDAVAGEPMTLRLALLDEFANPAIAAEATTLALEVDEGRAALPPAVRLEAGRAWTEVALTAGEPGTLRIRAVDAARHLAATTNPIVVHASAPETRIYWGDLHSHTEVSGDGVGSGAEAYEYARHVAGLDFYSRTDHNSYFEPGNLVADFAAYAGLADAHDDPGAFATLHGYEVSFGSPWGHHNVYFRGAPMEVGDEYTSTLPEIWKALRAGAGAQPGTVLTIPHHAMKMPAVVDWSDADDPDLRRNLEIYSAHGLAESYEPDHPLAYEQSLFTNPSSTQRSGTSAQRAWEDGRWLSTIASSDDHRAQPGQAHNGLVAVRATALTREDVFDALAARRTYATTGARIVLDFSVGGVPMGGRLRRAAAGGPLAIEISAVGTAVIDLVEVLRHVVGRPGFHVLAAHRPLADSIEWTLEDDPGDASAIYYVRLRQRESIGGRLPMAWSSPVWVDRD